MEDSSLQLYCPGHILRLLVAKFTIEAGIFVTGYLAVSSLVFPARFGTGKVLRVTHTIGTVVDMPTGVEPEIVTYGW